MSASSSMRGLPAVHRFLSDPRFAAFEALLGREHVKRGITHTLDDLRRQPEEGVPSYEALAASAIERFERDASQTLLPVINATGVLLHTNLGRAPLAIAALDGMRRVGAGYSNLEYDLMQGIRGSRYAHASTQLCSLTGAADALVVNNCAAAVLLVLDTFARGREVIVARSQLVEIGGGFRLSEVLERSGAHVVEVGAANKVYLADFERALTTASALILRSHPSNYRIEGFTGHVEVRDLVALGRRAGIPVVEDLGSGALVDLTQYGLPRERMVQDALDEGIDLVAFSGDKILGGPQAGIILGTAPLVARLRSNPLLRALRVDKLTLAALTETLRIYACPERLHEIPLLAMLGATVETLRARAQRYCAVVGGLETRQSLAYAGGGALPQSSIPSLAVSLSPKGGAQRIAERLRRMPTPIVARVEENRVLLDLRTIAPNQDDEVIAALRTVTA